jgi:hypothetical protein
MNVHIVFVEEGILKNVDFDTYKQAENYINTNISHLPEDDYLIFYGDRVLTKRIEIPATTAIKLLK